MALKNQKALSVNLPLCIWMQAGVVKRKSCKINYNCPECRFDIAMRHMAEENNIIRNKGHVPKGNKGKISYWKERLRSLPLARRPCVHHMKVLKV